MNKNKLKALLKKEFGVEVSIETTKYNFLHNDRYFEKNSNIYDSSDCWFEKIEFDNETTEKEINVIKEIHSSEDIPDEDELQGMANHRLTESLAYWTIYFQPNYMDIGIAHKVGLVPFTFDGEDYLALGGCGMDLSPKLDAYQALTDNTINKNSTLFSDKNYFEYVVGKKTTKEVLKSVTRNNKLITVTWEEK